MNYYPRQQVVTDLHGVLDVEVVLTTLDGQQVLLCRDVNGKSQLVYPPMIVGTCLGCIEPCSGYITTVPV